MTSLAIWLLLAVCTYFSWVKVRQSRSLPLPPGPKRYPLVGNAFQMPQEHQYRTFAEWKQKWGNYIYLRVFGLDVLVINSYKVAKDLLEKRSDHISDRPRLVMAGETMGWNKATAISSFNSNFKNHRRLLARTVGGKNAERFWPVEERERRRFLLHLFEEPERLIELIRRLEGAVILDISHGYSVQWKKSGDPFVTMAEKCMDQFSLSTTYGAFLVDMFPAMRFIPEWLPGGRWKKIGREWGANLTATIEEPFAFVKNEMAAGRARTSFTSQMLTSAEEDEELIKAAAFSLYTGGSDTAVSALTMFFLLMVLNPEQQKKAQAEIDEVTKGQYLPTFQDRHKLPYVEAVMLESLRWGPIAPMAFPHRCMTEDVYEGYRIPEGTLCLPNLWGMMHDPEYYTDPFEFKPERFMKDPPELDPRNIVFGFGRR
ncbi:hypothetical protein VKT23_006493 [Stygiomarasmius scandens]|uniref:Cytochrome P450 n=1 Tax=Marasmiellus scandens TaxID=2682957 RepID=A0ABR1JSB3_9AGAR